MVKRIAILILILPISQAWAGFTVSDATFLSTLRQVVATDAVLDYTNNLVYRNPFDVGQDVFQSRDTNAVGAEVMHMTNFPLFVAGAVGRSGVHFNGTDQLGSTLATNSLNISNRHSVMLWLCVQRWQDFGIIACGSNLFPWGVSMPAGGANGYLRGIVRGVSSNVQVTNKTALASNVWFHWAYTWDGTSAIGYVNGVSNNIGTGTIGALTNVTGKIQIGCNWSGGMPANYFQGSMDELRLYNDALTPAQIAQTYAWQVDHATNETSPLVVSAGQFFKAPYFTNGSPPSTDGLSAAYKKVHANFGTYSARDNSSGIPLLTQAKYFNVPPEWSLTFNRPVAIGTLETNFVIGTNWLAIPIRTNIGSQFMSLNPVENSVYQFAFRWYTVVGYTNKYPDANNQDLCSIYGDPSGYLVAQSSATNVGNVHTVGYHQQAALPFQPSAGPLPANALLEGNIFFDLIRGFGRITVRNAVNRVVVYDRAAAGYPTGAGVGIGSQDFNFNYITITLEGTNYIGPSFWWTNMNQNPFI